MYYAATQRPCQTHGHRVSLSRGPHSLDRQCAARRAGPFDPQWGKHDRQEADQNPANHSRIPRGALRLVVTSLIRH